MLWAKCPVNGLIGGAATQDAGQPGGSGLADNDLLTVAQSVNPAINSTSDAAFLEFDFVPSSNVASFNFVFSSDEYLTYVNTIFNDVFAFYVSGPGIVGPFASPAAFPGGSQNVAVVPGTNTPITISTIHPGLNAAFYVNNTGNTFSHNGFTVPIPVELDVQCGETYHFKFAIADCSDSFLNTAVFLEAGSFVSDAVDVTVATVSGDSTIVEGCTDANLYNRIDNQLKLNRRILKNFNKSGKATVRKEILLKEGFNPKYFTNYWKNSKNEVYLFCYEFGFIERKENDRVKYVLIHWQDYMEKSVVVI